MIIEIDQSGKLEDTNKDTVIACVGNHFYRSVLITSSEKRKLQAIFRNIGKPRMYVYRVFTVLIFILIQRHLKKFDRIIIDQEYTGKEELLHNLIYNDIKKFNSKFDPNIIVFQEIGKKSKAHILVYNVYKKRQHPDRVITAEDIMKIIVK